MVFRLNFYALNLWAHKLQVVWHSPTTILRPREAVPRAGEAKKEKGECGVWGWLKPDLSFSKKAQKYGLVKK